ncbi:MAG TPA: hypothetical protein VK859_08915 [bacterium]|jgi:hypothetical protein|nr:hypothetical protein [bacterium]
MTRTRFWLWLNLCLIPLSGLAQENARPDLFQLEAIPEPVQIGLRYDDNASRAVSLEDRLPDEIYSLNLGGEVSPRYDIFKGDLDYHLGADQYQLYSVFDNLINDFNISISVNPDEWSFTYKKEFYIRTSDDSDFNYFDDNNIFDIQWSPPGPRDYETGYKYYAREYFDQSNNYQSRNFVDQEILMAIQQELDEKFSLKLEGNYNNRQFNRNPVGLENGVPVDQPGIQTDTTWSGILSAHIYFDSILQDFSFEHQRTNSNSYGFSNTVESISWAAVIRPASSLYLQLFFRLYSKVYDIPPLSGANLQIGYVDEDSQDLLSIKTSWEWSPQWMANLSLSRLRVESTQPGEYYITDILALEVQRNF